MPDKACRKQLDGIELGACQNAGLLLARYLKDAVPENPNAKPPLISAAIEACRSALPVYKHAFERWMSALPAGAWHEECRVEGRMVIGLGSQNVLESGITLHHTYGVPVIPGAALKGLAAHYCDQVWGWGEKGNEGYRKDVRFRPSERDAKENDEYKKALPQAAERVGAPPPNRQSRAKIPPLPTQHPPLPPCCRTNQSGWDPAAP